MLRWVTRAVTRKIAIERLRPRTGSGPGVRLATGLGAGLRQCLCLCLGVSLAACGLGEGRKTGPEQVLGRIGAESFGLRDAEERVFAREAHAAIGAEARPVLEAPVSRRVGSALWIDPDAEGRLHASFVLAPAVAGLPDSAFSLELQKLELPQGAGDLPGIPQEVLDGIQKGTFTQIVTSVWTLERQGAADPDATARSDAEAGDRVRVSYTPEQTNTPFSYNLHLAVLEPSTPRFESRVFEVVAGSRLELAYGLSSMPGAVGEQPVNFAADLRCGDDAPRSVVRATLPAGGERHWHEAQVPLPDASEACALTLTNAGPRGESVRGALWAVPRVIGPAPTGAERDLNVVVVSLDTLRADHLSGYGYPRLTSPGIDAELMARGATFLDLTSTYSRTDVSHMSMLSGLYPAARPDPASLHPDTPLPLLAEAFAAAGYETAAFAEDGLFAGSLGFWFGFDSFTERAYVDRDRGVVSFAAARAWLRENADRRFFLFVHTYKTHAPYAANEPYAGLFRDPAEWRREGMSPVPPRHREIADEYDRTIREADALVVGLLESIASLGLEEHTLVVLTSDHGEAFGEHGSLGHSYAPQQEVMHVPLVLRGPGVPAGLRIDVPVSQVDITPTLLDLAGLAPLAVAQGVSLAPALRGETLAPDRPLHFAWAGNYARGVRYGPWKFRDNKQGGKLTDVASDPGERRPRRLNAEQRRVVDTYLADHEAESAAIREGFGSADPDGLPRVISEDVEDSLRALGYIE